MKNLYLLLLSIVNFSAFAQDADPGYFINNSGSRIDCLINNIDWQDNPREFFYKSSEADSYIKADIATVKEFGIGLVKYVRANVDIDQSSEKMQTLSKDVKPVFERHTVFLNVLVDGTAKLYYYRNEDMRRYFYSINDRPIEQLIFKTYLREEEKMKQNTTFRMQLFTNVKCYDALLSSVQDLQYDRKELVEYFDKVNACKGDIQKEHAEVKKPSFNLKVQVVVNNSNFAVVSPQVFRAIDFGNITTIGFGFEAEYILAFHNYRWSLFSDPTYNSMKDEGVITSALLTDPEEDVSYNLKYVQVPLGVRHYIPVSANSKVFVNAAINWVFVGKSSIIEYERRSELTFHPNVAALSVGAGFQFKDFSAELRAISLNKLKSENVEGYDFTNLSFSLKYKFL
ncbi:MAG TPA: hypothetical protein VF581_06760 [Flavobacterium sp.]|jgi:hypothetical protein